MCYHMVRFAMEAAYPCGDTALGRKLWDAVLSMYCNSSRNCDNFDNVGGL